MMNMVKEFGQIQINHRLISVLEIAGCFGDRGVSATVRAESVTAVVKGRFEDRLQDLEDRLLNRPVDHVWNAEPALSAPWLRQPDAAYFARPITFRQQVTAQSGDDR